jgi:hypothetical protein
MILQFNNSKGGVKMNETALLLGCAIALGYYFYTRRRERIISKREAASGAQEQETSKT